MKKLINEEVKRIRQIMGLNESHGVLSESRQTEEQSINFLRKNNIENPEEIVKRFASKDKSKNQKNLPIMAYLYVMGNRGDSSADIESIIEVVNEYEDILIDNKIKPIQITKGGLVIGEKTFNDFLKFSEYIHAVKSTFATKTPSSVTSEFKAEKKPLWSGNNIDIYEGNNVGKCIAYTQGGVTGRAYSFCVGQPGNTMYKSYRDSKLSSFYFIVDRNKFKTNEDGSVNLDDPLHIVVFDMTSRGIELTDADNKTGTIAEYGQDVNGYVDYLKSKGVPVEKLVNRPKTEQEIYEDRLLGSRNTDLSWFMNLDNPRNPDYKKPKLEPGQTEQNYYKSAYIGRGHLLTDEQFDFLMGK